jgi:hypothetical protein
MTDAPTPATPPTDPAPPTPTPRRWDWRPKARWFAAEYLIVVLGVLTAVALNAWWGDRQSAAQEHVYLGQLAADLASTADRLEGSRGAMRRSMEASSKLLVAFNAPDRADPDSVVAWAAAVVWNDRPGLALGVARALVSTDLSLVRDDSVRTAIFQLLTYAERNASMEGVTYAAFIDYSNQLRPFAPMAGRIAATLPPGDSTSGYYPVLPFEADRRVAFPMDADALLRSREAYTVVDGLYDMAADMRVFQAFMLARVRDLQGVLARRGVDAP